jgi:hypothetical protein
MHLYLSWLRYWYNHLVFSNGFCFIRCWGMSFQGGTFQFSFGQWGFSSPGWGIGWASKPATGPDKRQDDCIGGGVDAGPVGGSACVGVRPEGGMDWGDWEFDYQGRGAGGWVGRQHQLKEWTPPWLQWH